MILNSTSAVRFTRLHPPLGLLVPVSSSSSVHRSTGVATFCFGAEMEGPVKKTDQKPSAEEEEEEEVLKRDMMGESFGEGYATRSDEEGFGGIYGYSVVVQTKRSHTTDFDKSQGSEVKEKENSRHQTHKHG